LFLHSLRRLARSRVMMHPLQRSRSEAEVGRGGDSSEAEAEVGRGGVLLPRPRLRSGEAESFS
jgi:hypothetical protein